jgi:hypothetical protein
MQRKLISGRKAQKEIELRRGKSAFFARLSNEIVDITELEIVVKEVVHDNHEPREPSGYGLAAFLCMVLATTARPLACETLENIHQADR